jgi:hypothetical protein
MPCIVLPVKFNGGLSISVLRNKQLFKKGAQKFTFSVGSDFFNFKLRHLKKGQTLEKVLLFWSPFSCERDKRPIFKFDINLEVLFIYRMIPSKANFPGRLAILYTTPIVRFLGAFRSVHDRIQHIIACFWVSVDRYALHRAAC